MKKWKTLSSEIINKNPWTEFRHDRFEMPNGYQGDYYYIQTPGGSVAVVPVLNDGRLVLVSQHRYLFDRTSLTFPVGGVKEAQTPEEGARAELLEESGYSAGKIDLLAKTAPSHGLIKEYTHTYLATDLSEGIPNPDDTEQIEVVLMSAEEIDAAIASGEIWDGFTIIAWYFARPSVLKIIQSL